MKKIFYMSLIAVVSLVSNSWAQPVSLAKPTAGTVVLDKIPEETKELVRRLLEANGTRSSLVMIFEDIIKKAPPASRAELRRLLRSDTIIDRLIPIYAKYFAPNELRDLVTFYKTPVGKKNLQLTPTIMNEVLQTSAQYFEENAKYFEETPTSMPQSKVSPATKK